MNKTIIQSLAACGGIFMVIVVFENTVVNIQQLSESIEEIGFFPSLGRARAQ